MDAPTLMAPPGTPEYCLLWINHWATCMSKSEWSGWAQVVGATLAVLAAVLVPAIQHVASERRALNAMRREYERVVRLHLSVASQALHAVRRAMHDAIDARASVPRYRGKRKSELRQSLDTFERLPLDNLYSAYAVNVVLSMRRTLTSALVHIDRPLNVGPMALGADGEAENAGQWRALHGTFNDDFMRLEWAARAIWTSDEPPPGE